MFRRLFLKCLTFSPLSFLFRSSPTEPAELPRGMDARDWARSWMEHIARNPSIATDEGCMIGWFANAIMAGFDEAARRFKPSTDTADEFHKL